MEFIMIKTKFVIAGLLVSAFYMIEPSAGAQPVAGPTRRNPRLYDLPGLMNSLPPELAREVFDRIAKPIVEERYNPRPEVENALRAALGDEYNQLRYSFGNGDVMTRSQCLYLKFFVLGIAAGRNGRQERDLVRKELVETREIPNPVGPMTLNHIVAENAEQQAAQLRREQRAHSSTWQRFSAILGGRCCRR